jgi:hypothetical protein
VVSMTSRTTETRFVRSAPPESETTIAVRSGVRPAVEICSA